MKLGFLFGGLTAGLVAVQVVGCLGGPFVTTGGSGGGSSSSSGSGTGGGVSVTTGTSSSTGGMTCAPGMIDCGSGCTNLQTDPANCNTCGKACGPMATCTGGTCSCASMELYCGPIVGCAKPDTAHHCGSCNACPHPNTDVCISGACYCTGGVNLDCNGTCADIGTDPNNCGKCGTKCGPAATCVATKCTCRAGFSTCTTPTGPSCFDLQHEGHHCGICSTACQGGTDKCSAGTCVSDCPASAPNECSNKGCYSDEQFLTDPLNCGGCDKPCEPSKSCVAGTCL